MASNRAMFEHASGFENKVCAMQGPGGWQVALTVSVDSSVRFVRLGRGPLRALPSKMLQVGRQQRFDMERPVSTQERPQGGRGSTLRQVQQQ
jgi:hypothetical protein